jgi:hypothetical protein
MPAGALLRGISGYPFRYRLAGHTPSRGECHALASPAWIATDLHYIKAPDEKLIKTKG